MFLSRLRSIFLVSCTAAILAAGCSQGNNSLSPTGPTAVPDSAAAAFDDADGVVTAASTADEFAALRKGGSNSGGGKDSDKDKGDKGKESDDEKEKGGRGGSSGSDDDVKKPKGHDDEDELEDDDDEGPGRRGRGSVSGFVTAVGSDSITVRGIVVKITTDTIIRHGNRHLKIADIHVGDHAQAKGTMSADGKTLTATEVKVEDTGNDDDDDDDADKVELRGAISGLGPTTGTTGCPTITFTVSGKTVKTNAKTEFDGVTCAALANGNVVEVEGTTQTDGSVLAKEVELETSPDEVEGKVTAITTGTSCPTLTFSVGTATVKTTATTSYPTGTSCATIAVGKKIEAEGTKGTDGVLTATSIEFD